MATPLTPLLQGEKLLEWLLKRYPNHTREELIQLVDEYGFAPMVPTPTQRGAVSSGSNRV